MRQTSLSADVRRLAGDVGRTLGEFFWGQLIIAAILAVGHTAAFYVVEMPLWWFAGPLVGALSIFPYVGFVAAALAVTLIAALGGMTAGGTLKVWLILASGQLIEAFYLIPKILGRRLSLHPVGVFFVVLAGGVLFGPLGAFLAAPLAAVALLLWRRRSTADLSSK